MPISVSDDELDAVMSAAAPPAPKDRNSFLRAMAVELARHRGEIGPGLIHRVARDVQKRYFDAPDLFGSGGVSKYQR